MTRRRSPWPLAAALLLAGGRLASAQDAPPPPPPPGAPAGPAANIAPPPVKGGPVGVAVLVNGQPISRARVQHLAVISPGYKAAYQQALQQVIADALVQQDAKKKGVTVTPAELNARVAQLRQQLATQYPGGLDAALRSQGVSFADFEGTLRVRLLAEKLLAPVHRAHIHYIVVLTVTPPGAPPAPGAKPHTDAEAQAIIAKAQADLKAGQTFEATVAKYSEDPGKNTGGDIGLIGPESTGQLDPAFVQAALALKPGEVTPAPVHSAQFGYFLLKCVSTSETATGTEKALYDQAAQQSLRPRVLAYLQDLAKHSKITNYFTP